jgi:soluble lytic murein transglycosylase-like protein
MPPEDPGPVFIGSREVSMPPRRDCPIEYQQILNTEASKAGIPIEVLESIIWAESRFLPTVRSPARKDGHRDLGLAQFNSRYLKWYSNKYNGGVLFDPMVPEEAVRIAALHIRYLYERYGHWPDVVLAYNAGITAVDKGRVPESAVRYLLKVYNR